MQMLGPATTNNIEMTFLKRQKSNIKHTSSNITVTCLIALQIFFMQRNVTLGEYMNEGYTSFL